MNDAPSAPTLPVRKKLPHGPPPFPVAGPVVQFVTINAETRGGAPFLSVAETILESAAFYHGCGRWFLHLFLVMPDHLHMLASFPGSSSGKATCGTWKAYLRKTAGIRFQGDCFEHRIRDAEEFADKWNYIRENPVRKGLVATPENWNLWIAFDPRTGAPLHGRDGSAGTQSPPWRNGSAGTPRPTGAGQPPA